MDRPDNYPDRTLTPAEARRRFLDLLGPLDAQVPLNFRFTGLPQDLGDGLLRHRVVYDAAPGEQIPAYLFLHADDRPRPAVLSMHGHGSHFDTGKDQVATPSLTLTTAHAYRAAREGFVALAPDAICFGERRVQGGFSKDFFYEIILAMEHFSMGRSLAWKTVFDIARAMDALEQLPQVQADRIGIIGCSGGSIQSYLATVCDTRIRACVALQSFITMRHQLWGYRLAHCLYPYVPRLIATGVDYDQLVASIVPRKLFMGWGRKDDGTPEVMTRAFFDAVEAESVRQGVEGCVELFASDAGHMPTPEMMDAAFAFLHGELGE